MLRRHWTFLVALIPLLGWWTYGLFDLDEGFYAAIAQEMNRRGEWITPFYNGEPWFEKPILIYWLLKPSLWLFGDVWGPRIPSIAATIGLYAVCAWFAKRRLSVEAARWTPLVLGTSLLVVGAGRMVLTDPLLDLAVVGAFVTFWESLVGDRRWRIAAAACLGLGVLAKGPVAGILFIPAVAYTYWKVPTLRPAFRGQWFVGIAVFALLTASWYVPCYLQNGQLFVQKFLIEQNVGRFQGGDVAHAVPFFPFGWAVYIAVLLVGFAPWSYFAPRAWRQEGDLPVYLRAWAATVFIFFTIGKAKLPHYILPVIPPLGLLVAAELARRSKRLEKSLPWVAASAVIAQGGFWVYYNGIEGNVKGFHAEVHRLARYVHDHAAPTDEVAAYALPKQKGFKAAKGLQETSHPSLLLYLDRTVIDTKDWDTILNPHSSWLVLPFTPVSEWESALHPKRNPLWIITRANRIGPIERAAAGSRLHEIDPVPPDLYRLYRLDP